MSFDQLLKQRIREHAISTMKWRLAHEVRKEDA